MKKTRTTRSARRQPAQLLLPLGFQQLTRPTHSNLLDECRYDQLVRMLRLVRRIEGRLYCPPLHVLARDLDVCERTVRRYLNAIGRAGVVVPPPFTEYKRDAEVAL